MLLLKTGVYSLLNEGYKLEHTRKERTRYKGEQAAEVVV